MAGLAKESTLESLVAELTTVLGVLQGTLTVHQDNVPADRATQTTQAAVLAALQGAVTVHQDNVPADRATQTTLAAVLAALPALMADATGQAVAQAVNEVAYRLSANQGAHALPYAKDASDQLRITGTVNTAALWGNTSTYPSWYGTGAPTSIDQRELIGEMSRQTYALNRQRWVFS